MWGWWDKAEYVWKRNRPLMLTARHIMILKCDPRNAPAEQYHCITEKIRIKGKLWSTLAKTQNCLGGWGGGTVSSINSRRRPHPHYILHTGELHRLMIQHGCTENQHPRSRSEAKPMENPVTRHQGSGESSEYGQCAHLWKQKTGLLVKKNKKKTTRRKKGAAFKTEMCPLGHDRKKIKRLKI